MPVKPATMVAASFLTSERLSDKNSTSSSTSSFSFFFSSSLSVADIVYQSLLSFFLSSLGLRLCFARALFCDDDRMMIDLWLI